MVEYLLVSMEQKHTIIVGEHMETKTTVLEQMVISILVEIEIQVQDKYSKLKT